MIEAMIAVSMLFFIVVSVIAAFASQLTVNRRSDQKTIAMELAESQMEELLKLPAREIPPVIPEKYFVLGARGVSEYNASPNVKNQMHRFVNSVIVGNMMNLQVTVEYGYNGIYKGRVILRSTRGGM